MINRQIAIVLAAFFYSGEFFLDGHEVWRIRRQEKQIAFCIFNDLFCCGRFVERGVVENDDSAGLKFRDKLSFQPQIERVRVACSFEQKWRCQFLARQSGDQTGARTEVAGAESVHRLAAQGVAVVSLCRAFKAGFIDVNESFVLLRQFVMSLEITAANIFIAQRFFIPPRFFYGSVSFHASRN